MNVGKRVVGRPWTCHNCQVLARRAQSTLGRPSKLPSPPPPSGAAKLTTRRLISLQGPDAPKLLQGIVTNSVRPESQIGFYAGFLTAQGKILNDVFVYPTFGTLWANEQEPGYMVEVDSEQANSLMAHLRRHKLRSKLAIRLLDEGELDVWSTWKEEEKWTRHSATLGELSAGDTSRVLGLQDKRASGMGTRVLLPSGSGSSSPLESHPSLESLPEVPLSAYTIRRYLQGVPEGQAEIPRDNSFPMNTNIDLMGGIDFKKGCYLGQELTIRTHHTGVVRRRILPVALYEASQAPPEKLEYDDQTTVTAPTYDVEIKVQGKRGKPGKWIAGIGNIGLAMCRLEMMTDLAVTVEPSQFSPEDRFTIQVGEDAGGQVGVKAFVPDWLRGQIKTPKVQKRVE